MEQKQREIDDEIAALARYVDQPGQWEDVTPEEVKEAQKEAWKAFLDEMRTKEPEA